MRRFFWVKTGLLAGPALCLLLTVAQADEIGRIKGAVGDASIERAGETIKPKPGEILEQSDVLQTGPTGRVAATFIDNSRFSAGPNSRIELSTFAYDPTTQQGEFVASVEKGSLAIVSGKIAKSTPDAMKVKLPSAILGVRGTRFVVEVSR
ncbi:MAG: FecR family protein [Alphaproteobacteria bacterium]